MLPKLSEKDIERIYELAQKYTGCCQVGSYRKDVIISNIQKRMSYYELNSLESYISKVEKDPLEQNFMISSLTIHTTEWFRERPHFEKLKQYFKGLPISQRNRNLRFLSCACSTGQEVYSIGCLCEILKILKTIDEYYIEGFDLDPISIEMAKKGEYDISELLKVPLEYQHLFMIQGGKMSPHKNMIQRSHFFVDHLTFPKQVHSFYDVVFCRNVLIYFEPEKVKEIIQHLKKFLKNEGILILGHSESIDLSLEGFSSLGHSMYKVFY